MKTEYFERILNISRPDLAKEWHPTKNGGLNPSDVTYGSNKKVWWLGKCGHEWQAAVKSRSNNRGCPFCSGRKVLTGFNDLQSKRPDIAKEWHPDLNEDLTPDKIIAGSHTKVWWKCKNNHVWSASPNHRTSKDRGCPYCCHNPLLLKGENDLQTLYPQIARSWHPIKNGDLTAEDVTASSDISVWWLCEKGHEWKTSPNHRVDGSGCPKCSRSRQTSFPEQVVYYYIKKYYEDSQNGYTDIFNKSGMELDIFIPSQMVGIEYDGMAFHKNNVQYKREVEKYRICREKGIKLIRIRENIKRMDTDTCDVLLFNNKSIQRTLYDLKCYLPCLDDIDVDRDYNDILYRFQKVLYEKSLENLYPKIAEEWHPYRNGNLTPDMFSARSNQKVWWKCKKNHEWIATLDSRVRGTGCPYCSNNIIKVGENDLAHKRPDLIKEWDFDKNIFEPDSITPGSGKKAWWICEKGHSWYAEISSRNKGHGCPYCAGTKR